MSYEKVKSIKIDETENKVFITCASNNVRPLFYDRAEFNSLSELLKTEGKEAVELRILKLYEEGSLQQGTNKFTKALKVLRYVYGKEYNNFDWRADDSRYGTPEYKAHRELRESEAFKELLRKTLNYKFPKGKFIITKEGYSGLSYGKAGSRALRWLWDKSRSSKFDFKEEAENYLRNFRGLTGIKVIEV